MDKIGKRFTLILILLFMLAVGFSNPVLPVKGQYYYASIHVTSPIQNQIYSTNTIPLNFTMDTNIVNQSVYSVASFLCNLDGNRDYTGGTAIPMSGIPDDFFQPVPNTYNTTINVPNGNHLLWVQIDFMVNDTSKFPKYVPTVVENLSQIVSFTVDTTNQPSPSPSLTPTPIPSSSPISTPTVPELSWLVILPLLLTFFYAVVLRHRKTVNLDR